MKSFKQYLEERESLVIDNINGEQLTNFFDDINESLDAVTEKPFINSAVFFNAIRGTVERYGIVIPSGYEMPMLSLEAETVYSLGDSGYYLYICHYTENDGGIYGYACITTEDDLDEIDALSDLKEKGGSGENLGPSAFLRQTRRTNDDSGNDNEYT